MKILHLIPYFTRATKTGGPALQLNRLATAEQALGNQVLIVTTTGNLDEEVDLDLHGDILEISEQGLPTIYHRRKTNYLPHSYYYAPSLPNWLQENIAPFDIVIIHGIWTYFSWVSSRICQKISKPYLIFVHGSLDPWALNHHRLKKLPYWYLIEKRSFLKASGVIVLSQDEMAQVQAQGINKDFFLARNGLLFPLKKTTVPDTIIRTLLPRLSGKRFVYFMSRLHSKKGIEMLLEAWWQLKDKFPDWQLIIAGPDEGGYLSKLQSIVRQLNLNDSVEFPGLVTGDMKAALLQSASIFVLPSFSEGVPGAVVDALAYGVPVVITPGCHLPEVSTAQAGLIVEPNSTAIATGLERLMADDALRQQMGGNAKHFARNEFDEMKVAVGLIDFCKDILPPCPEKA